MCIRDRVTQVSYLLAAVAKFDLQMWVFARVLASGLLHNLRGLVLNLYKCRSYLDS